MMNNKLDINKLMPNDKVSKQILHDRASLLSVEDNHEDDIRSLMIDYIKFVLNSDELYGIPYQDIQEIKPLSNITVVPMAPNFVLGIIYWRGKLIPVIDLATFFAINNPHHTEMKYVAVVVKDKNILALAFNDVFGVDNYLPETLDKNVAINNKIKDQYIHGIHQGRTTILNIMSVLSDIDKTLQNKKDQP